MKIVFEVKGTTHDFQATIGALLVGDMSPDLILPFKSDMLFTHMRVRKTLGMHG